MPTESTYTHTALIHGHNISCLTGRDAQLCGAVSGNKGTFVVCHRHTCATPGLARNTDVYTLL